MAGCFRCAVARQGLAASRLQRSAFARFVGGTSTQATPLRRPSLHLGRRPPTFLSSDLGLHHLRGYHPVLSATAEPDTKPTEETFTYQAEVDRLLDMIIHSLYSNREIFLRELISNCSDALDKLRLKSISDPSIMDAEPKMEIRVKADPDANVITIEDTGVGMTREELLDQLGTIARSGTKKFMEALQDAKGDTNLIGQFGVGFYSSFLVADRVQVASKSTESDTAWVWESEAGSHHFSIKEGPSDIPRGTRVTLHIKEDCREFVDSTKIKNLLKQYSEFISFPIMLFTSKREPVKVVDDEATEKAQEKENTAAEKEGREANTVDSVMKTDYEERWDWALQNENKPIWLQDSKNVTKEQYEDFFKTTFGEFLEPAAYTHFNVEGTLEFSALLFIPGMAPLDSDMMAKPKGIRLYVKRVFISDEFDDSLLPRYLSFIKGVVDSSDLPLNVSREILQENRIVRVMRKQMVRRSLDMMEELSKREDKSDYQRFFESFGNFLKYGVVEDSSNRERLASLLRFYSSKSGDEMTGLEEYVSRMQEGQKAIYYMAADSKKSAASAPFVEGLVKKGLEVFYLSEPTDEVCMANVGKYKEYEIVDVSKDDIKLNEEDEKKKEQAAEEFKPLCDFIKKSLKDKIEKVTVSNRLTDSPCTVSTSKFGWSANMERIMRNQPMADSRAAEYMRGKKVMEINPEHPLIKSLKEEIAANQESKKAKVISELLYETSLLTSGFVIESPKTYAQKVYSMISKAVQKPSKAPKTQKTPKAEENTQPDLETVTPDAIEESKDA